MLRTGTAGWGIPREAAADFPGEGQHLARYARVLPATEINTSFYRSHAQATYVRWASLTPAEFRFAVKLPRSITHFRRLHDVAEPLAQFLDEVAGLGAKLGPLLVQLPPSLACEARQAAEFFETLRMRHDGAVVCEPRHASWFEAPADALLRDYRIGRVAADPFTHPGSDRLGGWLGDTPEGRGATTYLRLHGSPRRYWSSYTDEQLAQWATTLDRYPHADAWCIFDNTAGGAATGNALTFSRTHERERKHDHGHGHGRAAA